MGWVGGWVGGWVYIDSIYAFFFRWSGGQAMDGKEEEEGIGLPWRVGMLSSLASFLSLSPSLSLARFFLLFFLSHCRVVVWYISLHTCMNRSNE